eukprot:CAMPEP_0196667166 /NCGR_PEP_ID=MMETSP1086-20130531/64931_1 /TAXON_ID=77921 /ORGANISM="Cyanoptyche  gloeocystis , Strain SAG4.97" /LENGTH=78 /DNA_ID=CAMNT_0042004463 /DNA_START=921 /DNA_END=1157 /DNA_ORIENTATION=+
MAAVLALVGGGPGRIDGGRGGGGGSGLGGCRGLLRFDGGIGAGGRGGFESPLRQNRFEAVFANSCYEDRLKYGHDVDL